MTEDQMNEVLAGVEDSVREFNRKGFEPVVAAGADLDPAPCLTDAERARVKAALLDLVEECRNGGGRVGELASDRLNAVARATEALMLL